MIIKVCGMRESENIRQVEALKPTMMGFICWDGTSRNVTQRPSYLPQCIRVGVFVNASLEEITEKVELLQLNRIQMHGQETAEFCRQVHETTGLPITKAISVHKREDIYIYKEYTSDCGVDLFLFDTKCKCVGGSGEKFDWDILQHYDGPTPFLLAGGIGPGDAERVRSFRHPRFAGIDLNSKFESSAAYKDIDLLKTFINQLL